MKPPACPKCGSQGLFRDDDRVNGLVAIACRFCGHRIYPGGGVAVIENEEEAMSKEKKPCRNCGRVLTIIGDGCCFVCYKAGKWLAGEEKERALAAVKARIQATGGHLRGRRKQRKAKQSAAAAPVGAVGILLEPEPGMCERIAEPVREIPIAVKLSIEIAVRLVPAA